MWRRKGVTSTGVPKSNPAAPDNRQQLAIAAFAAAEKAAIELEAVIVHDGVSRTDPNRGGRLLAELADGQLLAATDGTRHAWLRGDRFVMRSRGIKLVDNTVVPRSLFSGLSSYLPQNLTFCSVFVS